MTIRVREMTRTSLGNTGRVCGGCGHAATHQIIGQTVVGNEGTSESVDLCERCSERVSLDLLRREEKTTKKLIAPKRKKGRL